MPEFDVNGKTVKVEMTEIVQFFMYLSAAINLLLIKINTSEILITYYAVSDGSVVCSIRARLARLQSLMHLKT